MLNEFDIDFTIINEEVDGDFPNHSPDPTKEENLDQLKAEMKKGNCDIGIAFDGDGDRAIFCHKEYGILDSEKMMILFANSQSYSKDINSSIVLLSFSRKSTKSCLLPTK